jgi:hypothetical protein
MKQLDLFAAAGKIASSAPHSGGETSRAAAAAIRPDAGRLRQLVLQAIVERGTIGATDEEIQNALGLPGNTQRPRRRELEQVGLIRDSGQRRPTSSGRRAIVWVAIGTSEVAR